MNKREFLRYALCAPAVAALWTRTSAAMATSNAPQQSVSGPHTLPPLPYEYNALEPYIDTETMQIHHDRHHGSYVSNLNAAIAKYPDLAKRSAEDLIRNLASVPADIREQVRNNGGGHVNHTMFWQIMKPKGGGEPTGSLADEIRRTFGSFEAFKKQFNDAGMKRFGSGWVWLVRDRAGRLQIISTSNQDNPLMQGLYPIMGNDVWEHAYYLRYRNRRNEYLEAWWNVVNWDEIARRNEQSRQSRGGRRA